VHDEVNPVRWPGVVVVGGGVTGLLTALELDRHGVPVLIIEQSTLCSGQTGQCHGWLHRGGVFADAGLEDFELLNRGADWWTQLAERTGTTYGGVVCELGGRENATRVAVASVWDHLGLPYAAVDPPSDAYRWVLSGPERAVVPLNVLRAAVTASGVVLRVGRARKFRSGPDSNWAQALVVTAGQQNRTIVAQAFVVASGAGITDLLPTPQLSARLTRRLSFMLVVRSPDVPDGGLAIPEQGALGLFTVPRISANARVLLVSNFLSYAVSTDISHVQASWLAGMRPTLQTYLPAVWSAVDALWGVYSATKVEPVREFALGVASTAVWPSSFRNVWIGVPGKLVLAPLIARELASRVVEHLPASQPAPDPATLLTGMPAADWGPEEWEMTPLVSRETLFGD